MLFLHMKLSVSSHTLLQAMNNYYSAGRLGAPDGAVGVGIGIGEPRFTPVILSDSEGSR